MAWSYTSKHNFIHVHEKYVIILNLLFSSHDFKDQIHDMLVQGNVRSSKIPKVGGQVAIYFMDVSVQY
jgi:hypothetical protein